ncbi:hypothetical protein F4820DRAFT_74767 [Hypoxylon rubiginosum]|uniref:Uncharacterized protein n=1 Tax=Hypoxylon rubiginosum TaxID=110542 RepID=A0ACB9YPD7_9PEZI|nr:hypothetical protein F4820DRAFT_74767 [Hypoxylon rubiginosum]
MFAPYIVPYITHFYPLGNTPAVSLTRGLPQGLDADILLLGCGDARNVLFTAYCERGFPARKFDITCCDVEPGIIARNVILFTLLVDGVSAEHAWKIYFDFRIDKNTIQLIKDQAQKLLAMSENISQWTGGRYGSLIRFCDAVTLQQARRLWKKYAYLPESDRKAGFKTDLERTTSLRRTLLGKPGQQVPLTLTALRSAAPLSIPALAKGETTQAYEYYWKHGHLSKQSARIPNPLFADTLSQHTYLHYDTDPTLGFHLATAFANLGHESPLRPNRDDCDVFDVVGAAKSQFREWVAAFQGIPEDHITLRFTVCDALSFSHALEMPSISDGRSPNLFRRQLHATPLEFDPTAYGTAGSAPTRFDVIDTSNLADHLSTLNLLVATAPLLKRSANSTLWTETLLKREKSQKEQFDSLLCGHAPTICLFLGLSPVEYWTNATSVSCVDETVIGSMASSSQSHSRSAWKLSAPLQQPHDSMPPYVEPRALSNAIFQVHSQMFKDESLEGSSWELPFVESLHPLFHRGSLAALMWRVRDNLSTEWPSFWDQLMQMIHQSTKARLQYTHRLDLDLQLLLHGLITVTDRVQPNPSLGGLFAWKSIPELVCVTVVVPREKFDEMYAAPNCKLYAATFEGILDIKGPIAQNSFSDVNLVFGHVEASGEREDDDFSVAVRQDPLGWLGTSPLIASYFVPSKPLEVEPWDVKVGLGYYNAALNLNISGKFLPSDVYQTTLGDSSNVFITKYKPGMSGYPLSREESARTTRTIAIPNDKPMNAWITADLEGTRLTSLCVHVDYSLSRRGKALLAEKATVELRQPSPFLIDIVLGTAEDHVTHSITFPVPVRVETAKMRIAHTSAYVEVIAPVADPLTSEYLSTYMYPITLGKDSVPVCHNSYQVNLDALPVLDVDKSHAKANGWMNTLTSHQFSLRERALRELGQPAAAPLPLRVNFKESVFTMFMLASGLQGGQTGLFALQHPEDGNQMLIFIRAILINGPEGSVVADAAVLPLTRALVDSGELEPFLLLLRELQIGAIRVDDAELALWKRALPAFAERCRTWSHGPACEYKQPGAAVPLSTKRGEQFLCSCGNGKLPAGFTSLPDWDAVAAKHAVRIAISPTFSAPFVEDVVDTVLFRKQGGVEGLRMDKCRGCNATETRSGGRLLKCGRCKDTTYCSAQCQRADWKKHRMECKPEDAA